MPMFKVPVECPECHQQSFVINPGDKYYCLNEQCLYQARLPTDPEMSHEDNRRVYRYYVRKLEEQVLQFRNVDIGQFRRGDDDGRPKLVFGPIPHPDPDYSCGSDFCDDPACVTHNPRKEDQEDSTRICIHTVGRTYCGYTEDKHVKKDGSPMDHLFQGGFLVECSCRGFLHECETCQGTGRIATTVKPLAIKRTDDDLEV